MKKRKHLDSGSLNDLIDELTAEAGSDDERIWNFQQALQEHIGPPCEGLVIGEPVMVVEFGYDGNQRRAVTAKCRRADGREYEVVAAYDVVIPASLPGADYLAAYRQWVGFEPNPPTESRTRDTSRPGGVAPSIDLCGSVELVVLSVKQKAARCRLLGGDRIFTLRVGRLWDAVPGEIAVVRPRKQWTYAGSVYLSGVIESTRIEANAWAWSHSSSRTEAHGTRASTTGAKKESPSRIGPSQLLPADPRGEFEMEQVLPGEDPEDPFSDLSRNPMTGRTLATRRERTKF
jgi:hypothetical protein